MISVKPITFTTPGYHLTNEERETIISFDETSDPVNVYTFNKAIIRKLDNWYESGEPLQLVRAESLNGTECREYKVPKSWIRVQRPRQYTEEQKKSMVERFQKGKNSA